MVMINKMGRLREKEERETISHFLSPATVLGEFSFTKKENKSRKAGVGKDGEFSFVNIEFEDPETFSQSHLAVD